MSLKKRLLRAGAWTSVGYSIEMITRFGSNLILTRLLFPEAFGLVAASTSLLIGLSLISDFGIRAVIIQSPKGDTEGFLRSAWVFQVSRGFILWIILAAACGLISTPLVRNLIPASSVYHDPSFAGLTLALGLTLLVAGTESTTVGLNYRHLNYKPIILLDLIGKISPVPIMIGCAMYSPSVWTLALGAIVGSLLRAALSHTLLPGPRMAWKWQPSHIDEIVRFGKWITLSSVATFVSSQSDVILFGVLFPGAVVGVYFIAKNLADAIEGFLEKLNGALTLPVLGEVLRNNPDNLRDRYYRLRFPIDIVAASAGGFLFVGGTEIVKALYDSRYASAGPVLSLLGIGLATYPLQLIRSAFTAVGKTSIVAFVSILQAASLITLMIAGYFIAGSLGAVAGIATSRIIPSSVMIYLAHQRNWISVWYELRIVPIFGIGMLAGCLFIWLANQITRLAIL
jgi:O-antigen/teichoic acid export membrane protein